MFWTLIGAFRHLGSPFWPFLSIFGAPEAPRKFSRQAPKRSFETCIGGKKVQKHVFLASCQKRSLKQSITPRILLVFGNASKRARICLDTHQEQVCAPKGTRNRSQKFHSPPMMTVKSKKVQNFKIFKGVPMCVYTYYGVGNVQY